ncbi:MAG: hypothetical protein AAF632_28110 [Bacteroidota bacterium]
MKPRKRILLILTIASGVLLSLLALIKPMGYSPVPTAVSSEAATVEVAPPIQFYELPLNLKFGVEDIAVLPDHEILVAGKDGVYRSRHEGQHVYADQVLPHNSYSITVTDSMVLLLSNRYPFISDNTKRRERGIKYHKLNLRVSYDGARSFERLIKRKTYQKLAHYAYDSKNQQLVTASPTRFTLWKMAGSKPIVIGEERFMKGRQIRNLALQDERLAYATNDSKLSIRPLVRPLGEDTVSFGQSFYEGILAMKLGGEQGSSCYITVGDPANADDAGMPMPGGVLYHKADGERLRNVTPLRINGIVYRYLKLIDVRADGAALCYSAERNALLLVRRVGSKVLVRFPFEAGSLNAVSYDSEQQMLYCGFEGSGTSLYYVFRKSNGLQAPGGLVYQTNGKVYYGHLPSEWWDDRSESAAIEAPIVQRTTTNSTAI